MRENLDLDIQTQRVRRLKMPEMPRQASEMLIEDISQPISDPEVLGTPLSTANKLALDTSEASSEVAALHTTPVSEVDSSNGNRPLPTPDKSVGATPTRVPASQSDNTSSVKTSKKQKALVLRSEHDATKAQMVQERCRQICLSLFFREQAPVRSLGFTSSVHGEGKSFLSMVTADVLAKDSSVPVTLLECNWENPSFHKHFEFSSTLGLADWFRGECSERNIRHSVGHNLTVIPAGNGKGDAVKLLQQLRQRGLMNMLARYNELLVVDLPSIAVNAYGSLAASLVESIIVVVRAGVTPDMMVAETCSQLNNLPVHGLLLNQVESQIPRWLRKIL